MAQVHIGSAASPAASSFVRASGPLHFTANGSFQISIFEDLHFGENAWDTWGPQQDVNSVIVINEILDAESPDLVVLNGDLITGENGFLENATVYIEQIVGPLLDRDLPWASTYGNHDHQYNVSAAALLAHEQQWPSSRTQSMVDSANAGTTNYYLPVYNSTCTDPEPTTCTPELILWFFDSRGGARFQNLDADGNQIGLENWVDTSVVDWFQQTSSLFTNTYQKTIPSLAFVHIPTTASLAYQNVGVNLTTNPGINDDVPLAAQGQGWCANGTNADACGYGGQDVPFLQAIAGLPGLIAVFSGHDHGDTWCFKWNSLLPNMTVAGNGVNLCFGQHSGYGGYGSWTRGARQVRVDMGKLGEGVLEADSWIRLETGEEVDRLVLSAKSIERW